MLAILLKRYNQKEIFWDICFKKSIFGGTIPLIHRTRHHLKNLLRMSGNFMIFHTTKYGGDFVLLKPKISSFWPAYTEETNLLELWHNKSVHQTNPLSSVNWISLFLFFFSYIWIKNLNQKIYIKKQFNIVLEFETLMYLKCVELKK